MTAGHQSKDKVNSDNIFTITSGGERRSQSTVSFINIFRLRSVTNEWLKSDLKASSDVKKGRKGQMLEGSLYSELRFHNIFCFFLYCDVKKTSTFEWWCIINVTRLKGLFLWQSDPR